MRFPRRAVLALFAIFSLVAAACGDGDGVADEVADDITEETSVTAPVEPPTVVVTTNILGDVVSNLVGDQMEVITIMPVGADPHDFQASAQQVATISDAEVLIVNGEAFEEGLLDVIESAEDDGVPVHEAINGVSTIEFGESGHDHDEHGDEDHDEHDHDKDEDHADHDGHDDHDDHDGHEDHADEAGHTEFHAEYAMVCEVPENVTQITFAYFDTFPNALEVEVQIITADGAQAFEVERDAPVLDLGG